MKRTILKMTSATILASIIACNSGNLEESNVETVTSQTSATPDNVNRDEQALQIFLDNMEILDDQDGVSFTYMFSRLFAKPSWTEAFNKTRHHCVENKEHMAMDNEIVCSLEIDTHMLDKIKTVTFEYFLNTDEEGVIHDGSLKTIFNLKLDNKYVSSDELIENAELTTEDAALMTLLNNAESLKDPRGDSGPGKTVATLLKEALLNEEVSHNFIKECGIVGGTDSTYECEFSLNGASDGWEYSTVIRYRVEVEEGRIPASVQDGIVYVDLID